MIELNKLVKIIKNLKDLSSKSKESIPEAILKLVEETGELSSCYLKENNPEHLIEEASDVIQAAIKLAYIIGTQYPEEVNFLDKLLEKNEKWRKSIEAAR